MDCCCRDIPEDVLNTFCWIHSTFTVVDASRNIITDQAHYPGVLFTGSRPIRQVRYYQWVAFVLFFQVTKDLKNSHLRDLNKGPSAKQQTKCSVVTFDIFLKYKIFFCGTQGPIL